MAVVTLYGSRSMTNIANTTPTAKAPPGVGGGRSHIWSETVEFSSTDSASSTALMARLPSNARIFGNSKVYWDQLSSIADTAVVGIYNIGSTTRITDSPCVFTTTALATSVANSGALITDIANYGKRLWEYTSNTTDPGGDFDIKFKKLGDNTEAGTVTIEIHYATD